MNLPAPRSIDLKWLLPHIFQLVVIVALLSGWKSEMDVRVRSLEARVTQSDQVIERVTRLEEKVSSIYAQGERFEKKLDLALERRL